MTSITTPIIIRMVPESSYGDCSEGMIQPHPWLSLKTIVLYLVIGGSL
jgi:hypothetical protein